MRHYKSISSAFILTAFQVSAIAQAAELEIRSHIDTLTESNSERSTSNAEEETLLSAGLSTRYTTVTSPLDLNINYEFNRRNYLNNTGDDENILTGSTRLRYQALAPQFQLLFYHDIQQTVTDNREDNTTQNQETRQIYSLSPSFYARLTKVDSITANASVSRTQFEDSEDSDNDRYTASAGYYHQISLRSNIGLSLVASQIEFLEETSLDYNYQAATISSEHQTISGLLNLSWGVNQISTEGREDRAGQTLTISWQSPTTSAQQFGLSYEKRLTDSTVGLLDTTGASTTSTQQAVENRSGQVADTQEDELARASHTLPFSNGRNTLATSLSWQKTKLQSSNREDRTLALRTQLNHRFGMLLTGSLAYQWQEREEVENALMAYTQEYSASLSKQHTRSLSSAVNIGHQRERQNRVGDGGYENTSIRLRLDYLLY